jgi:hypothetical protein
VYVVCLYLEFTLRSYTSMNFNRTIASELGVNCAILLSNIYFWVEMNEASHSELHYKDGHYWTFNAITAFEKVFDFLTKSQIRTALDKLEESGYLHSGRFNKFGADKTKWYRPSEKALKVLCDKSQISERKIANQSAINHQPIPDITSNINTDINSNITVSNKLVEPSQAQASTRKSKSSKVKKEVILVNPESVQSMLIYFYEVLLPGSPKIFSPTNRKVLDSLITAHGLKDLRDTIDKAKSLLGVQYAPQISNISVFATKYLTIKNYQRGGYQPTIHI